MGPYVLYFLAVEILRTITLYTTSKNMPFVIIGGHALNSLGLSRHTGDLDLLVPNGDRDLWLELLSQLRYKPLQNDQFFARFRAEDISSWPIDLMFVGNETFLKFKQASKPVEFGLCKADVASAEHLISLKIHALKKYQEHRHAKDFSDLLFLIKKSGIKMEDLNALCLKYANQQLFEKIKVTIDHEQ